MYEDSHSYSSAASHTRADPLEDSPMEDIIPQPREKSELSIDIPLAMPTPFMPAAEDHPEASTSQISRASAPSPAPTEIIPVELSLDEIQEDLQSRGIKVRDYAYHPAPGETRAPETFDPLLMWNTYEDTLTNNVNPKRNPISGKILRRLLDLNWINEADKQRWLPQDHQSLAEHDSRPHYPWTAYKVDKPSRDTLALTARERFLELNRDQLGPQIMRAGLTRFNHGPGYNAHSARVQEKKREARELSEPDLGENVKSPKRRKLDDGSVSPNGLASTSSPAPSLASPFAHAQSPSMLSSIAEENRSPLGFVNGRPPKQYPAGKPSDFSYASSSQNARAHPSSPTPSSSSPRPSSQNRSLRRTESSINVRENGHAPRRSLDRSDSSQLIHAASS